MANTETEARIAQTIADLAAGLDAQEFLQGAAEGLGMVIATLATDSSHVVKFANVLAGNVTGHACSYLYSSKQAK